MIVRDATTRPVRVLHVITGLGDGGAEAVLYRLCQADAAAIHQVVSLMGPGKYGPLLEKGGVRVHCLNMPRGKVSAKGLLQLWRLLRAERPDIVQTWMYHADLIGGTLARMAGVRRVFWGVRHSTLEVGKSRRATMLVSRINAWLSSAVPTGIVCCAEKAREVHLALGFAAERLLVIPNGYDLSRFRPDSLARVRLRSELGLGDQTPLLGMVGRFDPQKDHENLFRALALLKQRGTQFCCALVGRGMDQGNTALCAWLGRYGLQAEVMLLGQRSDVPSVMSALDLHLLSSSAEAFPNVLAEAMACGTPCVTTDVGDAAAIVGETGWVVPPLRPERLADAINTALLARSDREAWAIRCKSARQRVGDNFSMEKMVKAYHAVWQDSG